MRKPKFMKVIGLALIFMVVLSQNARKWNTRSGIQSDYVRETTITGGDKQLFRWNSNL